MHNPWNKLLPTCVVIASLVSQPLHGADPALLQRIKDAGGSYTVDTNRPSEPVTRVFLVGKKVSDQLVAEVVALPDLEKLQLSYRQGVAPGAIPRLKDLRQLHALEVAGDQFNDDWFKEITELKKLVALKVSSNTLTDDAVKALPLLSDLEELDLGGKQLSDVALEHVVKVKRLRKLVLGSDRFTDRGLKAVVEIPALTNLTLHSDGFTDQALAEVGKMTGLTELVLSRGTMTDQGLAQLKGLKKLEVLRIYLDKGISDAGMKHIKELPQLRELDLALIDADVTDAGLRELQGMNTLQVLVLQGTKVTEKGAAELKQALPGLKIVRDP